MPGQRDRNERQETHGHERTEQEVALLMQHLLPVYGFIYFGMPNSLVPTLMFLAIMLSWVPHGMMYRPQAAPIAGCFTPRLRYSGSLDRLSARLDYGRGPAPLGG